MRIFLFNLLNKLANYINPDHIKDLYMPDILQVACLSSDGNKVLITHPMAKPLIVEYKEGKIRTHIAEYVNGRWGE